MTYFHLSRQATAKHSLMSTKELKISQLCGYRHTRKILPSFRSCRIYNSLCQPGLYFSIKKFVWTWESCHSFLLPLAMNVCVACFLSLFGVSCIYFWGQLSWVCRFLLHAYLFKTFRFSFYFMSNLLMLCFCRRNGVEVKSGRLCTAIILG